MLKRLIKYDMRAISKIAVPMFISSGTISLLCCAVLYFTFGFANELNSVFKAFMITGGLYLVGVLTIVVMLAIVLFTIIARYYRSVFSDEGYLNMVIPVTRRNFLDSKIISSVLWFVMTSFVAWGCVIISLILPTLLYDISLVSVAFEAIRLEMGIGNENVLFGITALILKLFLALVNTVKDVMLIITAVTLGATLMKRLKISGSVLLYFIIGFSEELFVDAASFLLRWVTVDHAWLSLIFDSVFEFFVSVVIYIIGYVVTIYVLEKRLNLE